MFCVPVALWLLRMLFFNTLSFIIVSAIFYIIACILFNSNSQKYSYNIAKYLPVGWAKLLQSENRRNTTPFL